MFLLQLMLTQTLDVGPVWPKVAKYVAYTLHLDTGVYKLICLFI